jgi:hypothetical protein
MPSVVITHNAHIETAIEEALDMKQTIGTFTEAAMASALRSSRRNPLEP